MKSYVSPPNMVVMVMKACCLLFGHEESWESSKKYLLSDIKFIDKLIEFDARNCDESRFGKL